MPFKSCVRHKLMLPPAVTTLSVLCLVLGNSFGFAAEQGSFYQGKVIRIIVGTPPGCASHRTSLGQIHSGQSSNAC
jgi:hypothetical protein